jgi:hypothetical protein
MPVDFCSMLFEPMVSTAAGGELITKAAEDVHEPLYCTCR